MLKREEAERLKYDLWPKVTEELDEIIRAAENELRTVTPERLGVVQERIRTLERVKGLPDLAIERSSPEEE